MEQYKANSLAAGLIFPFSPMEAEKKKDGSLRPCIDYRGLNEITIRKKYPLPLMHAAFSPLHKACFFMKLDLGNTDHLIQICQGDEWKTAFNIPLGSFWSCCLVYQMLPLAFRHSWTARYAGSCLWILTTFWFFQRPWVSMFSWFSDGFTVTYSETRGSLGTVYF